VERPSPTRTNLTTLRRRIEITRRGLDLLRGKRDALVREFLAVMKRVVAGRDAVDAAMREATDRVVVAWGLEGRSALVSAALRRATPVSVEIEARNVWGVRMPDVRYRPLRRADAGSAPMQVEIAADAFEHALDLILENLSPHILLKRLGGEIKRTTRRINALNEVVLPTLSRQVQEIRLALEERDREEVFRTKRFRVREVEP
jgi:V/A-type H+-transporting ATPase subunit D